MRQLSKDKALEPRPETAGETNQQKIRKMVNNKENQHGFQKGRTTTEPMFCLRVTEENFRERKMDLHMVFVDLESIYDTIPCKLIWFRLRNRQISEDCIRITKDMTTEVRTGSGNTYRIHVEVELHQRSTINLF